MSPIPQVSILLPVRDADSTLELCLRSIRRQRGADWELIAVDDGSVDRSPALLAQAAEADPRVRLIRQSAQGIVAALNHGLEFCRAQVVARMDADDWMHRDRLALQWAALQADPELDFVGCHVRCFPRDRLTDGMRNYEAWLNRMRDAACVHRDAFIECPLAHPSLAARTEALRRLGYRDRGWPEDYDLLLRAQAAGHKLSVVPRRLLAWRDGPSRLQRTDPSYGEDRFTDCKASHLRDGFLADDPHYVLWGHGGTGRKIKRALRAHHRTPAAIVEVHPGRIGNRIEDAPVIAPDRLPEYRGMKILVSVSGEQARRQIRAAMTEMGFHEGADFVCVA